MYIPAHFAPDEATVGELLRNHGAADLVTVTAEGLVATMLPFVWVPAAGVRITSALTELTSCEVAPL